MTVRRVHLSILIVVAFTMTAPAWSASLDDARRLHEEGRTEEALAEIESLLSSGVAAEEQAAALDLLGTIAVDEGQLALAKQAWTRLTNEHPDYAKSHDTATKLRLVSALLLAAEPPAPPAEPTDETVPSPITPVPAPPVESSPAATAEPTPPAAPAPVTSSRVLVAAKGRPHDAVRELSDRVVEHLREKGVDAESATGGIPVVENSKMVLPMLFQKGQMESAGSVLLLSADFVSMQKVALDCYTPSGAKLWKLKVSGGTGWKGRPYTKSGITEELAERFIEKLDKKIGQPGLPVTLE